MNGKLTEIAKVQRWAVSLNSSLCSAAMPFTPQAAALEFI